MFLHWSLEKQNLEKNNLQSALSKSSPTMRTLVGELFIFWGFQDFMVYFLSVLNSPNLIFQLLLCKSNVNKSYLIKQFN